MTPLRLPSHGFSRQPLLREEPLRSTGLACSHGEQRHALRMYLQASKRARCPRKAKLSASAGSGAVRLLERAYCIPWAADSHH